MEIELREEMVTDEKLVSEALRNFENLFLKMPFEDRAQLINLLIERVTVSRFVPEKDESTCDPGMFKTKIRTAWYRIEFKFFIKSLFREAYGSGGGGNKSSHPSQNGGEGGIRTPGTLSGSTDFESVTFGHSATSPRKAED